MILTGAECSTETGKGEGRPHTLGGAGTAVSGSWARIMRGKNGPLMPAGFAASGGNIS